MDTLETLSNTSNDSKGPLLEEVVRAMLRDFGFLGVRRQYAGTQFGFDLMAHRIQKDDGRSEVWKFECKNVASPISLTDLAPKLIWQFGSTTIDYFVIVSVTDIANDVQHLLESVQLPMPVILWTGDMLERLIQISPSACRLLSQPSPSARYDPQLLTAVIYRPAQPVSLDVVHSMDPPREFAYSLINDHIIKHYTDNEFHLLCYLSNSGREICHVHRLACLTEKYTENTGRTLRLVKPKGIYEPPTFRFRPSTSVGSEVDVLNGLAWKVAGEDREAIKIALDENTPPGCYQISFRTLGTRGGARLALRSASFPLRCGTAPNELILMVAGKHYDTGADAVLRSPDEIWNRLVALSQERDAFLYLGPTLADVTMRRPEPRTWIVQQISQIHDDNSKSEIVVDLGVSIDEELYSLSIATARVKGCDGWQDLLPVQLERRRRESVR